MHRKIVDFIQTFCNDVGLSWALSIIFMATSRPVGICRANLTLAKFPLPIVYKENFYLYKKKWIKLLTLLNRYLPICGSFGSFRILLDCRRVEEEDDVAASDDGVLLLLLLLFWWWWSFVDDF
jgi:hypothetical protein